MDHFQRSARNTFAAVPLDRRAERREDGQWLQRQLTARSTRFLLLHNGDCLLDAAQEQRPLLVGPEAVAALLKDGRAAVMLGESSAGSRYFSIELNARHALLRQHPDTIGLRQAASLFDAEHAGLCAYAVAMYQWHARHRYCGRCGSRNRILSAGHRLQCSNAECAHSTFPRIDPAMIVLVTHHDRCLLGRQPNWPAKRYSCLAGFVEPGESLEDTVRREVFEEAGVRLDRIEYQSSQPWPFPSSIMLGFTATAADASITVGDELEDARWWSVADIQAGVAADALRLPYELSISWQLLADWYQTQTSQPLAQLDARHAHRQA